MAHYQTKPGTPVEAFRLEVGPEGELPDNIRPNLLNRGTYQFQPDPAIDRWLQIREGEWMVFEGERRYAMTNMAFHQNMQPVGDSPKFKSGAKRLPGYGPAKSTPPKPKTKFEKAVDKQSKSKSKPKGTPKEEN